MCAKYIHQYFYKIYCVLNTKINRTKNDVETIKNIFLLNPIFCVQITMPGNIFFCVQKQYFLFKLPHFLMNRLAPKVIILRKSQATQNSK